MIPYGKHAVDQDDINAVVEVLENRFLTQGDIVPQFEKALCNYTTADYAVAVNSGTSGLHIACLALGIGAGDVVWTVPNSFVASANCALYCGAQIDFVDIDPDTYNLCIQALQIKLQHAHANNQLPKALVVVHFAGASADMQAIAELTQPYGIALIEDAAHGLGGSYQDNKIGCCQYSSMAVLSFHPVKSITSAEGGAVLTNSRELAEKLALYAKHGVTRNPVLMDKVQAADQGAWYYQQIALGYNYRLSDVHAALGLSQLSKLDAFIQRRTQLAERYQQLLQSLALKLPAISDDSKSAWHLYMVQLTKHDRQQVYSALQQAEVGVNVHYIPIHLQPFYRTLGFNPGDFAVAETYYANALTLPLFPSLSEQQQDYIVSQLHRVLG